jgi:polysaccharide pyruvyl transferase WcaK-like protein
MSRGEIRAVRILVDQSDYELMNVGDIAILQSCVIRLRQQWPDAEIMVVGHALERIVTYCPGTVAVARASGQPFPRLVPQKYLPVWESTLPYFAGRLGRGRPGRWPARTAVQAVRSADVVVAAGGGYVTDSFRWHATGVLRLLSLAQRLGKPTAMFGHGLGPVSERALRTQARAVLPKLTMLSLREDRLGPDLALSLGARPSAMTVTGDEALELTTDTGAPDGQALGVNMRVSGYAGVDPAAAAAIGDLLLECAGGLQAPIVALPVSRGAAGDDLGAIRALLRPEPSRSDIVLSDFVTPEALITAAAGCRAIVTGSYHAAVFGLAQGVPTICLTKSSYYDAKFAGLRALFPSACSVVSLDQPDFAAQLRTAIDEAWHLPAPARAAAREAATRQRHAGREAYARFRGAVGKSPVMVAADS